MIAKRICNLVSNKAGILYSGIFNNSLGCCKFWRTLINSIIMKRQSKMVLMQSKVSNFANIGICAFYLQQVQLSTGWFLQEADQHEVFFHSEFYGLQRRSCLLYDWWIFQHLHGFYMFRPIRWSHAGHRDRHEDSFQDKCISSVRMMMWYRDYRSGIHGERSCFLCCIPISFWGRQISW